MRSKSPAFLVALYAAVAFLLCGCPDIKQQFVGSRVLDKCDVAWPVCDTISGCLLGDLSYIEGKFPDSSAKVAVQLFEPSEVTVSFFLENVAGSGEETAISFYEDRCRSRVRQTINGRSFVGEMEQNGVVKRSQTLQGAGDHLIEIESDARLSYLLKVDVLPLRLKE